MRTIDVLFNERPFTYLILTYEVTIRVQTMQVGL